MTTTTTVTCEMRSDCTAPVTHLDNKGYVYCTGHGQQRRGWGTPCRRLRPAELARIRNGQPVQKY